MIRANLNGELTLNIYSIRNIETINIATKN